MKNPDWQSCTNPQTMLGWLSHPAHPAPPQPGARKLRLFAAACCRRHWGLLSARGRRAVELMERYADGLRDEVQKADLRKGMVSFSTTAAGSSSFFAGGAITYLLGDQSDDVVGYAMAVSSWSAGAGRSWAEEQAAQADILRDLVGERPSFHTPTRDDIEPRWLDWNDSTVRRLAQAIYDERAFERLPILADALEEAGCTKEWILKHARASGVHVRGCWLVDLLRSADG